MVSLNKKAVRVDGVGKEVLFVCSTRARRISISIRMFGPVRVAYPKRCSLKAARKFFDSHLEWVKKAVESTLEKEKAHLETLGPGSRTARINRSEAKVFLTERTRELADMYGFSYNRLTVRNQRTRWGSCSSRDNISLNMQLMRLRRELRDYVILHELAHTKHKNHSRRFWAALDEVAARHIESLNGQIQKGEGFNFDEKGQGLLFASGEDNNKRQAVLDVPVKCKTGFAKKLDRELKKHLL